MPTYDKIALYSEPMLVITDLDNPRLCLIHFLSEWCQGLQMPPTFVFRIAVTEIESWLLADRDRIAQWLGISQTLRPRKPEDVEHPKEYLVRLASRSRYRKIREAIVPATQSTRSTGPGYINTSAHSLAIYGTPENARIAAPSLDRAIDRIVKLPTNPQPPPNAARAGAPQWLRQGVRPAWNAERAEPVPARRWLQHR